MINNVKNRLYTRFPKITNLYDAFLPIYLLNHICGVTGYKSSKEKGRNCYKITVWTISRCIVQSLMLSAFCTYRLMKIIEGDEIAWGSKFLKKLGIMQSILSEMLCAGDMVFCIIFANMIVNSFSKLDKIDLFFKTLSVDVHYG